MNRSWIAVGSLAMVLSSPGVGADQPSFDPIRFAILNSALDSGAILEALQAAGLGPVRVLQRLPEQGWLLAREESPRDLPSYLRAVAELELGFPSPLVKSPIPDSWETVRRTVLVQGSRGRGVEDEEIEARLAALGVIGGAQYWGVDRLWLFEPDSPRTGIEILQALNDLEAEPEIDEVYSRPLLVVPSDWPASWFYWYDDDPYPLALAADSFTVQGVEIGQQELLDALTELAGSETFDVAASLGGNLGYFVCFPELGNARRVSLELLFRRIVEAGIGNPSPAFESGLYRVLLSTRAYVRFIEGVGAVERIGILERVGSVLQLTDWLDLGKVSVEGSTGVDWLQAVNLLHQHPRVEWADLSKATLGPGPDDPGSPQVTPCELF